MPVILMEKDPFTELEASLENNPSFDANVNVRRPVYGMLPKWAGDGQSRFSYLSLYVDETTGGTPRSVSLLDSSAPGGYSDANHNFILQSVQEARQEKVQILETFGDHFAFFYGEKPIIWQCTGMLFNTADFNWKNEFLKNYDQYLRGTKCVENRARVFMGADDVLAQGYMINVRVIYDKDMPSVCPVNFSLLLTKPPLDLSEALDPVKKAEGGRILRASAEQPQEVLVEYVTGLADRGKYVVDPATGAIIEERSPSEFIPGATESSRSAFWITGDNPVSKQWRENALQDINAALYSGQLGVDSVSAVQATRRNPASTQLGNRDAAAVTVASSLTTGVSNTAVVVPDAVPV